MDERDKLHNPLTRYHYLMVREDRAAERAFEDGVNAAAEVLLQDAGEQFTRGDDGLAKILRNAARRVRDAPGYQLRLKFDHRHLDHALHVLSADDEIAEPLPEDEESSS